VIYWIGLNSTEAALRLMPSALPSDLALRQRWLHMLPAAFVTYSLAYLDRANYGFGAAAGLAKTLHITGYQSSLLGALFFLGYFLPQVPMIVLVQRHSARWMVFFALIAWGAFAALTGIIRVYWLLVIDRLLLGVAESFVFPAMLILLTRWFMRSERSRANAFMMLGNPFTVLWMSAVTGFLISAIGWQRAFIIEGLVSVLWGFVWLAVVRDYPREARWMDHAQRAAFERELECEQKLVPQIASLAIAFRQPNVARLCINYFFWSLGIYGFVLWLPVVIRNATGAAMGRTGVLSAAPYLAAILLMLGVSHFSDRTARRREFVWPFLILAGAALAGSYFSVERSFPLAFVCLIVAGSCMYAPYAPFFAMVPELLPRNVVGETIALINACGALGGFFGTWLVGLLQTFTGSSKAGFLLMSLSVIFSGLLLLGMKPLAATPDRLLGETG
jgi:sugar phosphate permease